MLFLVGLGICAVMLLAIRVAAVRFEAREEKAGRWDSAGPLVETMGPGKTTAERLEVIGEWDPPIIEDRRAGSHLPHATDERSPGDAD